MNPAARHLTGLVLIGAIALVVIAALAVWCSGRSSLRHHLGAAERDENDRASLPYPARCTRVRMPGDGRSHLLPAGYGVAASYPALCGARPGSGSEWAYGTTLTAVMGHCTACDLEAVKRGDGEQRGQGAAS